MNTGKIIRLGKIFRKSTGRAVIVALDHGRRHGPIKGIENFRNTVEKVTKADIDAILAAPAMIEEASDLISGRVSTIARIDGTGTVKGPDYTDDRLIASVNWAIRIGADAVAITVYIGSKREATLLEKLGNVSEECSEYGIPLLVEVIPSGPYIKDPYSLESIRYGARIVSEYGADIIKTFYSGSPESFKKITSSVHVPVVILGGAKRGNARDLFDAIYGSIKGGGKGVAIGRNIFQSENPTLMAQIISEIVHKDLKVEEAVKKLRLT